MNTKAIGEKTEAIILAALIKNNKVVLLPFGDNQRYDLVIHDKSFIRVQCKTGKLKKGAVRFRLCSTYGHRGRGPKDYKKDVDVFGVYCPHNDSVYIVPVADVGTREAALRLDKPKNAQVKKIRWAKDYILG